MPWQDVALLRQDLLFNGAVALSWREENPSLAQKAARHFIFHGPADSAAGLTDTVSFTAELLERLTGGGADDPFMMAVAGYGTGKSHLAVTLSALLTAPQGSLAGSILRNMEVADRELALRVRRQLAELAQPYLVVAINGMRDFDLGQEIIRQVLRALQRDGISTSVLDNLRPRFKSAINFVRAFYIHLREDFAAHFGACGSAEQIISLLQEQDELAFRRVNEIYEQKMGASIHTVGQESLPDFIRVVQEHYCGPGRPYAGLLIMFDEFGRYLEFAVQKPHVAGSGVLQQLFEAVQAHGERVFLVLFIQYELRAYISRVAPELRDELDRYVTRYDGVSRYRLSSNLETLIASLLEKKDQAELKRRVGLNQAVYEQCWRLLQKTLPGGISRSLWREQEDFYRVVCQGCWPLHPLSTWLLQRLAAGKELQQRSAITLLAGAYSSMAGQEQPAEALLRPVDLLTEDLLAEFVAGERLGGRGAAAQAYQEVCHKYGQRFTAEENAALQAVLLVTRLGLQIVEQADYLALLAQCCSLPEERLTAALAVLQGEYGVLSWNAALCQYDIVADAVPRQAFLDLMARRAQAVGAQRQVEIFHRHLANWLDKKELPVDFALENNISTPEFKYEVVFSSITLLGAQLEFAFGSWQEALAPDKSKGRLIYCYVGPESNLELVRQEAQRQLNALLARAGAAGGYGAPLAVVFLPDSQGELGRLMAEYWVLQEEMSSEEMNRYGHFIRERQASLLQEMTGCFDRLVECRQFLTATSESVPGNSLFQVLSNLFVAVYPARIPFPFDGFATVRGNAANDSFTFTRQLFQGNFNRDWIAALVRHSKNRAETLFVQTWKALDDAGQVRLKPGHPALRRLFDCLDNWLAKGEVDCPASLDPVGPCEREGTVGSDSAGTGGLLSLGQAVRAFCAPPFGLNLASAGLVLGLYFSRRLTSLQLLYKGQPVKVADWLSRAFAGKFFDLVVLEDTYFCRFSQQDISEWEKLLNDWELVEALDDWLVYEQRAVELQQKASPPGELFYKLELLRDKTRRQKARLVEFENTLNTALEKLEKGRQRQDVSQISWAAADLAGLFNLLGSSKHFWGQQRLDEVTKHYTAARFLVQKLFPDWLRGQSASSEVQLEKLKSKMKNVKANLECIDLDEEKEQLVQHMRQVEEHVHELARIKRVREDISRLVDKQIDDQITVVTLRGWLERVQELAGRLEQARCRADIAGRQIEEARCQLAEFQRNCLRQIEAIKERANKVFAFSVVKGMTDLYNLVREATALCHLYSGNPRDLEDLELVQRQAELMADHFRRLEQEQEQLDDGALRALCQSLRQELAEAFAGDVPPLDSESIYSSMLDLLMAERGRRAADWLARHLPETAVIEQWSAERCVRALQALQKRPAYLTPEQQQEVREAMGLLQQRLDDLAVEGLLTRFREMPPHQQRAFWQRLQQLAGAGIF
ncbi:hypothetical protein [Desulforamulus putei]|uniref:hypothetical protein n=1 Tax=Desulforamulus putei TaxID=74701 RepID=UPI00116030BF|nr:hypothetical protein [Desulforamulus putei]